MVPESRDVTRTEPGTPDVKVMEGDMYGLWAIILPILVGLVCGTLYSPLFGLAGAVATFILVAIFLMNTGSTWFQRTKIVPGNPPRQITENKWVADHRCCIQCKHPAKVLR
jgi:Na+/H+-translocating membrane pyrophosphatase